MYPIIFTFLQTKVDTGYTVQGTYVPHVTRTVLTHLILDTKVLMFYSLFLFLCAAPPCCVPSCASSELLTLTTHTHNSQLKLTIQTLCVVFLRGGIVEGTGDTKLHAGRSIVTIPY